MVVLNYWEKNILVSDLGLYLYPLARFAMNYEEYLDRTAESIQRKWEKRWVGILSTVIAHLVLLVVLLASRIEANMRLDTIEINVEFEDKDPEEAIAKLEQALLPADALVAKYEMEAIRNFAVDASNKDLNAKLSDEKNIDADELYSEAQRLKQEMQSNKEFYEDSQEALNAIPNTPQKEIPKDKKFNVDAPTVISYFLEGRKARHLPVPAYKCEFGGQVVVNIEVLPNGRIANASIDKALSVVDDCINSAAIQAAMSSIFTSTSQRTKQKGSITYLFVAQ